MLHVPGVAMQIGRKGQDERQRVLHDRGRAIGGCIADQHAASRHGRKVNVVGSGGHDADEFQPVSAAQVGFCKPNLVADDNIRISDSPCNLVGAGKPVDLPFIRQAGDWRQVNVPAKTVRIENNPEHPGLTRRCLVPFGNTVRVC